MWKYHYLVLFLTGFLAMWPFALHKLYTEQNSDTKAYKELLDEETKQPEENEEVPIQEPSYSGEDAVSDNQPEEETAKEIQDEQPNETQVIKEELSPVEFFRDTLFIGDSRTMGLSEYADLNNAAVFADTGMNIYRLYTKKNSVQGQDAYLEDILSKKSYRKIYLMLGINELGYDEAQTVKRYEEEVLNLQKRQPDAEIVLEANLHVTAARSNRDEIFNNEGINRINENIKMIAEKYGFTYIDVNELFDNEEGALNPEYTHDEVHVYGKYYQQWADWIKGVK